VPTFLNDVKISRDVKVKLFKFTDYFKGFEKVEAVRELFGDEVEKVLIALKVEFTSRRGYMGVSDQDGHLIVSAYYLKNGDEKDIYLDIIHELVHIKQFREGEKLFNTSFDYVDRPTEIEAYKHAVKEARKIGMTDKEICEYLRVEWMREEDIAKLSKIVGVRYDPCPNSSR
jgi:hypothetical protein